MRIKTLNQKHECWNGDLFSRYQSLYEGGEMFHKNISKFMYQNSLEGGQNYTARKREAFYESYVNSIINQFASQLFSASFVVRTDSENIDSFYSDFKEDVNLTGCDLVNFMRNSFISALIKGTSWIQAELPDDNNLPPDNLLDQESRGLDRAWLSTIDSENVFDWEYDEFGQLSWVIVYCKEIRRNDPRLERKTITETWKLYDQSDIEVYSISYELGKKPNDYDNLQLSPITKRAHGFTKVPILELRMPKGLWLMNRLSDVQIEHFRINNALGWSMRRACYPTAVFKSDDDDAGSLMASSDGFGVKIGTKESLEYIESPTGSFSVMLDRVKSLKDEIHRLALQMALAVDNSASNTARSGESKMQDSQATEICLHAYAAVVKEVIEEIYELISDARGDLALTFSIEGMDQFNIVNIEEMIKSAKLAQELNIPSPTFQKELKVQVADCLLSHAPQDIRDQVRKEIMTSKEVNMSVQAMPKMSNQEEGDDNSSPNEDQLQVGSRTEGPL